MNLSRPTRYLKGLIVTAVWRLSGASICDRVVVEGLTPYFRSLGRVMIGSRVMFRGNGMRSRVFVGHNGTLRIGDRTFINGGVRLDVSLEITIGERCLIGDGVQLRDSDYHEIDEGSGVRRLPISIGNNVWLGADCKIMPGVTIGDHSVVAGGAIVTRSVPDRTLVAGVPAREIRRIRASDTYRRT